MSVYYESIKSMESFHVVYAGIPTDGGYIYRESLLDDIVSQIKLKASSSGGMYGWISEPFSHHEDNWEEQYAADKEREMRMQDVKHASHRVLSGWVHRNDKSPPSLRISIECLSTPNGLILENAIEKNGCVFALRGKGQMKVGTIIVDEDKYDLISIDALIET